MRLICAMVFGFLLGCGGPARDSKQLVNVMPAPPVMAGTYDFDLLDSVVGTGCAVVGGASFTATVAGNHVGVSGLVGQAEAAAIYDALAKVKDADLLFVSRTTSDGDGSSKVCSTVFGRAIRLKKGPTLAPQGAALTTPEAPKGIVPLLGK
jgi:hypothetical protein